MTDHHRTGFNFLSHGSQVGASITDGMVFRDPFRSLKIRPVPTTLLPHGMAGPVPNLPRNVQGLLHPRRHDCYHNWKLCASSHLSIFVPKVLHRPWLLASFMRRISTLPGSE